MEGVCNDVVCMIHRYVHRANMNNVMVDLIYQTRWISYGISVYCATGLRIRDKMRITRIYDKDRARDWGYMFNINSNGRGV